MIRATTPTHTFTFPENLSNYTKVLITYVQNNKIVFEKDKEDLTISGKTASYKLTQEETNMFKEQEYVQVQIRVKMYDGTVLASKIFNMPVSQVLDDKEL